MQQSAIVFLSGLVILGLLFWYLASDVERRKRNVGSLLIASIIGLCIWSLAPRTEKSRFEAGELTALTEGQQGWELLVALKPKLDEKGKEIEVTERGLDIGLSELRKKLKLTDEGVAYSAVPPNQIKITLPGFLKTDAEKLIDVIEADKRVSPLKPGIDLAGGASFTVQVQPKKDEATGEVFEVTPDAVAQAIKVLRGRLNPEGTKDMLIQPQGQDRVIIEMPGVSEEESRYIEDRIEDTSVLELRKVHPQNDTLVAKVEAGEDIVPSYSLYPWEDRNEETGIVTMRSLLLAKRSPVEGKHVKQAWPDQGRAGVINVSLTSAGGRMMRDLTAPMQKGRDQLAIVLDGVVKSAPVVQDTLSSQFIIQGIDDNQERKDLCSTLMNPLENPLVKEQGTVVTARLGAATVKQGIYAGIAGIGLTLIFLIIYYRIAGLIALFGLSITTLIVFGAMAMFGFTFTLPGIAGIILTIGVAVDANVLIYERLREELQAGKSMRSAIQTAYEKAFTAIFDANITTLITAIILFWRASGTVKGFAITLTIGILASMFAALVATRVFFWWGADKGLVKKLGFLNLFQDKSINFMSMRRAAFLVSGVLLIGSLLAIGIRRESALGIDFAGGSIIRFQTDDQVVPEADARQALADLDLKKQPIIQNETEPYPSNANILSIRCDSDDEPRIIAELRKDIALLGELAEGNPETPPAPDPDAPGDTPEAPGSEGAETAAAGSGPDYKIDAPAAMVKASLGKDFLLNSLLALGLGLVCILIYITIRFEFSFAVGAFAALFHDIIIVVGIVIALGGELSLIHVGAFLTIVGYSINDTIVIFDRIRETLRMKRGDVEEIMNLAVNSTLSRTLLTSVTTFMAVFVLYFFGGDALKAFAFAIMVGVVVGTYSSIFVASPIVLLWSRARGTNLRRELLDANLEAQVNPARG